MSAGLTVQIVATPVVNHAMAHNGVGFLHRIVLVGGLQRLERLAVRAQLLDGDGQVLTRPWQHPLDALEAGATVVLDNPRVQLDPARLAVGEEHPAGQVQVSVWTEVDSDSDPTSGSDRGSDRGTGRGSDRDRMPAAQVSAPVRVLAARHWLLDPQAPVLSLELLAAFVQPHHPAIPALVGRAADLLEKATGSGSLAVTNVLPGRIDAIVEAICLAIHEHGIHYAPPPASWGYGQQVRTPGDLLEHRVGTCLDTTVLLAGALEHLRIQPVLWVARGHAFCGYWRQADSGLPDAASLQTALAINAVDLALMGVVETTLLTRERHPPRDLFRRAAQAPKDDYLYGRPADLLGVVDVGMARMLGVHPVAARRTRSDGVIEIVEYRPAPDPSATPMTSADLPPSAAGPSGGPAPDPANGSDRTSEPARVRVWKNALLDLSLRNRLLNFGHGVTQLPLLMPGEHLGLLAGLLQDGRSVSIRAVDDLAGAVAGAVATDAYGLPADVQRAMLRERHTVYTGADTETHKAAVARLRYRARTGLQETGANPLSLTFGRLDWRLGDRELSAPLLLAPVVLKGLIQPYKIELDETGELTLNLSLVEKLRVEFGLQLSGLDPLPALPEGGVDVDLVVRRVREAIAAAGLPFTVSTEARLAILGFTGYLLWRDLDEHWQRFLDRPLARHLALTPTEQFVDPAAGPIDATVTGLDTVVARAPIAADGSQAEAIAAAQAGRTYVLEGPPGTGKSQTITNILADQLSRGRTVLFVAEKGAALEVVRRRLADVGLLPFALDLHDEHARPSVVRQQLLAALRQTPRADLDGHRAAQSDTIGAATALSSYAQRVHAANGAGLSLYAAHTRRLARGPGPALTVSPALVGPDSALGSVDYRRVVEQAVGVLSSLDGSACAAWGFARHAAADPSGLVDAVAAADAAYAVAAARLTGADPVALTALAGADDADALARVAWLLSPEAVDVSVLDEAGTTRWQQARDELTARLQRCRAQAAPILAAFGPGVFDVPAEPIRQRVREAAASFFIGRKRRLLTASAPLLAHALPGARIAPTSLPVLVEQIAAAAAEATAVAQSWRSLPGLGALPQGAHPLSANGVAALEELLAAIDRDRAMLAELPEPERAATRAARRHGAIVLTDLYAALRTAADAMAVVFTETGADQGDVRTWARDRGGVWAAWGAGQSARSADRAGSALGRWAEAVAALAPLESAGLVRARWELLSGQVPALDGPAAADRGVADACVQERCETGGFASFDGSAQDRMVDRFVDSAAALRETLRGVLALQVVQQRPFEPGAFFGKVAALERELGRTRGGLSVRRLIQDFGEVIAEITPCLLVSPDSLARFVPPGCMDFDLVVFDEASQITVADAIGALGRARAAVVAGDSKQLPPTEFGAVRAEDAEDLMGPESADFAIVRDEESILSELVHAGVERRWLSWHYRSQDESLIAFSNSHYYEDRLSSFPARPSGNPALSDSGISVVRVDGTFHRTGTGGLLRTNPVEAHAVVTEILRRWQAGERSIGVVTFNLQQRTLIEKLLWDSGIDSVIESLARGTDGLFVKNLENVQGDERDVILFSTAFAKNASGVLPLNFGPLNRAGGERRLNVAITRARRRVIVFTSFDPADLRVEQTSSIGLAHLRRYLELGLGRPGGAARTDGTVAAVAAVPNPSDGRSIADGQRPSRVLIPDLDRHREAVAAALREAGLSASTGVGLSDFKVDIALGLPGQDACVAVLLDSPSWAGRRTTHDRDGLPRTVLRDQMGWSEVLRVWLPAWLADPAAVVAQVTARVHTAAQAPRRARGHVLATVVGTAYPLGMPPQDADSRTVHRPTLPTAPNVMQDSLVGDAADRDAAALPDVDPADPDPADQLEQLSDPPPLGALPYRPFEPGPRGALAVLDMAARGRRVAALTELIREIVHAEGPVSLNRTALLVVRCHGLSRLPAQRLVDLRGQVPEDLRRDPEDGFLWPLDRDPLRWEGFRTHDGPLKQRPLEEIALRELGNAMAAVTRAAMGIGVEDLLRAGLHLAGGTRMTSAAQTRLQAALRVAEQRGQLRVGGGMVTPAG